MIRTGLNSTAVCSRQGSLSRQHKKKKMNGDTARMYSGEHK